MRGPRVQAAVLFCALCALCARAPLCAPPTPPSDAIMTALGEELERSFAGLRKAEKEPLYYLAYELYDTRAYELTAFLGALHVETSRHDRLLDVDARVGNRRFDSTHQFKGPEGWMDAPSPGAGRMPSDDDPAALRAEVWLRTDKEYKAALSRYLKVRTNRAVTAKEEDTSDDFSREKPQRSYRLVLEPALDKGSLRARVRRLSAAMRAYPFLLDSGVSFSADTENRYILTTEGTRVATGNVYLRLSYRLAARTEDGMDLQRYRNYDAESVAGLPADAEILADIRRSASELKALLSAPLVEPYTGPAIIRNRATGVYFHEILGHRLEGNRQKTADEGQTFTKMLGKPVVARFITVRDDPTLARAGGTFLRGHYDFDDEGVPAAAATLVDHGILSGFLMSRSPIRGFASSNGHGRRSAGNDIVARMGNTVVEASETVPYARLREMLVAEIRRQRKPYGLILDDIAGGFTGTNRSGPQAFKVLPLLVWRVYPDGRRDEAVRGVDLVGTPLTSFSKILAAADDPAVFNGTCGAESGWVPVSAVAPSILVSEIEVEKKSKSSEKPPVLPSPLAEMGGR